jgi:hypothetical protein
VLSVTVRGLGDAVANFVNVQVYWIPGNLSGRFGLEARHLADRRDGIPPNGPERAMTPWTNRSAMAAAG